MPPSQSDLHVQLLWSSLQAFQQQLPKSPVHAAVQGRTDPVPIQGRACGRVSLSALQGALYSLPTRPHHSQHHLPRWQGFKLHLSKGSQQVHILPRCTDTFPHHLVTSDFLVGLNTSIIHYERKWNPLTFLPANEYHQMEETLKHVGELWLHQPDLSDLQYLTWLGAVQDSSISGSSTSAWAFNFACTAFIVSCVIIMGCLCFCTCRS